MLKVLLFSVLLIVGLVGSQFLPGLAGSSYAALTQVLKLLTMAALAFIMIHVGQEFEIDRSRLRSYGWDYVVAATAAAFPWIFCAVYFVLVLAPPAGWSSWDAWRDALLAGRFAAPTSAGVLFSMLAAAGLATTWVFRKTRILAIFDDLDTVLLMIPLKMMIVGWAWQLGVVIIVMAVQLAIAWRYLHRWRIPATWPWVLGYAGGLALVCEIIYLVSKLVDDVVPVHIEVLLPAFVLGCIMARPGDGGHGSGHAAHAASAAEARASTVISSVFMVLVGLSMPPLTGMGGTPEEVAAADAAVAQAYVVAEGGGAAVSPGADGPSWGWIVIHVLVVTVLANLGKMFPAFCYRREVGWRQRLAVAVAMFPRGEVGAGVLIISLSYGIGGPMITVAMLSLALNLLLTGVFIAVVQRLIVAEGAQGQEPG